MLIYIVCWDILFIHFPASTHRVVVATGSPLMMVTALFLQMWELLPEHPVTYTLEDMIPGPSPLISTASEPPASASCHPSGPGPSPLISTASEPPASASCHPSGISIHCSCASHSNAVPVRSANPAGNYHFKCKSPSMQVESCGKTPQQVPKYSIL